MRPLFPGVSPAVASAMSQDRGTTPQCSGHRITGYANDTPTTDKRCLFSARYEHEGRYYCTRHASALALAWMIKQSGLTP